MKALATLLLAALLSACSGNAGSPSLESLRGQWVLVNYWAQWCKPCIEEVPELNRLDADNPDITVLGVNFDGASGEALQAQIEKLGITFETLTTDPASQLQTERPQVLPTTLLIDPAGRLRQTLIGPQTQHSLLGAIEALTGTGTQ